MFGSVDRDRRPSYVFNMNEARPKGQRLAPASVADTYEKLGFRCDAERRDFLASVGAHSMTPDHRPALPVSNVSALVDDSRG